MGHEGRPLAKASVGWIPDDFGPEWHVVACEDFHAVDENEDPLAEPVGAFWAIYSRNHRE